MRTRLLLLSSVLAASLVPGCGDDGGGGSVDGRPVCSPMDDGNECTTDECVGGVPANTPRPGAACAGNGTCSAAGACVAPSCTDTAMPRRSKSARTAFSNRPACAGELPISGENGATQHLFCPMCGAPCTVVVTGKGQQMRAEARA